MNAAQIQAKIEKIVDSDLHRAEKARQLFDLGCDRTDVVELTGMTYSQAHGIWKAMGNESTGRVRTGKAKGHEPVGLPAEDTPFEALDRRVLRLSPEQTRVATQDGHRVVRVDTHENGSICRKCEQPVQYSIKYLAFVHTFSKKEPTRLEDYYE